MSNVLPFQYPDTATNQPSYTNRLAEDQALSSSIQVIDGFAGLVTGSFFEMFYCSGAVSNHLGGVFPEPYGGIAHANTDRVITGVFAMMVNSGSGGVTQIDVRCGGSSALSSSTTSIFPNNAAKVILSSSVGAFGAVRATSFKNSPQIWSAGTWLMPVVDTAALLQSDVSVVVYWKPSGSYNS